MKFLIFADPLSGLRADLDTGLALLREARARGHDTYWCTPEDFVLVDTEVYVYADQVTDCPEDALPPPQAILKNPRAHALRVRDFDGVWIRKDPPFDHIYLSICWLLSLEEKQVPILNSPSALARVHEKTLPILAVREGYLQPDDIAPFLLSTGTEFEFPPHYSQGELITKPWYGHGGRGVRKWKSLKELQGLGAAFKKDFVIFQHYMQNVSRDGDRRVFFFRGKMKDHFMRVPEPGMVVTNIVQGAKPVLKDLSAKEQRICDALGPFLNAHNLVFAGIDFMDERVSEINVTAPTGIQLAKKLRGTQIAKEYLDYAEELARAYSKA